MMEKVKRLAGKCAVCGKTHPLITDKVYIAPDATDRLIDALKASGDNCAVICDENTEKYARVIAAGASCAYFVLPTLRQLRT